VAALACAPLATARTAVPAIGCRSAPETINRNQREALAYPCPLICVWRAGEHVLAASEEHRYIEEEAAWIAYLQLYRELAVNDTKGYRTNIALALTNLGDLYTKTNRLADAEKAYGEVLVVYRSLATDSPLVYRADVASTLTSLGDIYSNTDRLAEAEKAYSEALAIYRGFASRQYASQVGSLTRRLSELNGGAAPTKR